MLLFKNKASGNYFGVNNQLGKIEFLPMPAVKAFKKYSYYLGSVEVLEVPDLPTIEQFRRVVKKGVLKDVPLTDTKSYLMTHYPEFFI